MVDTISGEITVALPTSRKNLLFSGTDSILGFREDELRRLRAQAVRTGAESDLRAAFDALKAAFERLMDKLGETETEDETLAAKYRTAFGKAMRIMAERVS